MNHDMQLPKRRWLCIAYAFPPANRSGTHRTAAFVRGLAPLGWEAIVLTVTPQAKEAVDPALLAGIPASTEVVVARLLQPVTSLKRALREYFGRARLNENFGCSRPQSAKTDSSEHSVIGGISALLATPDSRVGWILPAVWKGLGIIRKRRPEIIYSTSPYASAHLIALILNRLSRIAWIADFRDPWCGNPFQQRRSRIVEFLDACLERYVLKYASQIVCNTSTIKDNLVIRNPGIGSKACTITNGFDMESTTNVRPRRVAPTGKFVFLHCGQFYGPRSPLNLLNAFAQILAESPRVLDDVQIAFVGAPTFQGVSLTALGADAGLSNHVIVCGEKPHDKALELSAGADALILMGASGPGGDLQVPQKLFESLALRRPILGLFSPDNPAITILRDAHFDGVVCDLDDPAAIAQAIRHLIDPKRKTAPDAWSGVHKYARQFRVQELHEVFEGLAGQNARVAERSKVAAYATAKPVGASDARSKKNTTTASINIKAASVRRTRATQATLLPPAP